MQPSLSDFLLSAKGRISRSQFWLRWALPYIVVTVILEIVLFLLFDPLVAMIVLYVYLLAMLWPSIVVSIKRSHDRGRSGWFILLFLVQVVSLWPLIELMFLPGTSGNNGYGPNPVTA